MSDIALASMGAGCFIVEDNKVLLVRLNYGPAKGQFILPGGRVEKDEHPHQACIRELKEETGLDGEVVSQLSVRHRLDDNGKIDIYWVFRCNNISLTDVKLIWPEREIQEALFMDIDEALISDEVRSHTKSFIKIGLKQIDDKFIEHYYPNRKDIIYW